MRRARTHIGIASLALIAATLLLAACVQPGLEDTAEESGAVVSETRADALSLAPADAALAIVVNDLAALDVRVTELAGAAGHPMPERFLIDLVRDRLGGAAGLREDGAMMVVYPDAAALIDEVEPAVLGFVAVDDYRAFVGAQAAGVGSDGLDEVRVLDEIWHARLVEGYAVLSPDAERLAAYEPVVGHGNSLRQGIARLGESILDRSEIAAVINVAAMAPVIEPHVVEDAEDFAAAFENDEAVESADVEAMAALYRLAAETFMRDTQSLVFAANLTPEGASLEGAMNLRPESISASFLGLGGQAGYLFEQLPSGDLATAIALDLAGIDMRAATDWLLGTIPDGGPYYAFFADALGLVAGLDGIVSANYWTEGEEPDASSSVSVFQGDTARSLTAVVAGLLELVDGSDVYLPALSTEDDTTISAEGHWRTRWSDDAEAADALRVARFDVVPEVPASYLELASEQAQIQGWLPRERSGQIAVADAFAALTMNGGERQLEAVLDGVPEGARLSDVAQIAELRGWALQEGAFFELYDDVERLFRHWLPRQSETWMPMAVFGHLAQHEVAGQIVLTIEAITAVKGHH